MGEELSGKVAIVTGGAGGIGRGIVETFAAEGAAVVVADIDEARGKDLAAELGDVAAFKRTDVSDADEIQQVVDFAIEEFGGLHVMCNNAGIGGPRHRFLDDELLDFEAQIAREPLRRHGRRPARRPSHGAARRRIDHQHDVHRGDQRRGRADDLSRVEGRRHPHDPVRRRRPRRARDPRELCGPGPYPDGHQRHLRPVADHPEDAAAAAGRVAERMLRMPPSTWRATAPPRSPGSSCPSTAARPRAHPPPTCVSCSPSARATRRRERHHPRHGPLLLRRPPGSARGATGRCGNRGCRAPRPSVARV